MNDKTHTCEQRRKSIDCTCRHDDMNDLEMAWDEQSIMDRYGLEEKYASIVLENIQESLHQSLDGWTEEEKVVIQAYLADLAYATRLTAEDRVKSQIYTYVVYKSHYMYGEEPKMYEWRGTWRQLLVHLHSVTDDDVHEWAQGKTDEELKSLWDEMNGDGMPCYMVYNVEAREQVID